MDEAPVVETPEAAPPATDEKAWLASAAERLGEAVKEEKAAEQGEEAEATEAKAEPAKAKVLDTDPKRSKLEALAKELGFELDDSGKVTVRERAEWREAKAKAKARITQLEADAQARIQGVNQQWADKLSRVERIIAAEAADDPDELAKALGHDSWDALQKSRLDRLTDPNFKRIRELEKFKADQEAQRQTQQQQWEAQQRTQAQQQAYQTHMESLTASMKASKDPVCQALHDDPNALQIIFQIQRENYDPDTDTTVTPEQAVKMTPKGSKTAFMEHLKAIHARLDKVFGAKPEPKVVAKPKPKTGPAPSGAPAVTTWKGKGNDKEYMEYARQRMEEAQAQERAEKAAKRAR